MQWRLLSILGTWAPVAVPTITSSSGSHSLQLNTALMRPPGSCHVDWLGILTTNREASVTPLAEKRET